MTIFFNHDLFIVDKDDCWFPRDINKAPITEYYHNKESQHNIVLVKTNIRQPQSSGWKVAAKTRPSRRQK